MNNKKEKISDSQLTNTENFLKSYKIQKIMSSVSGMSDNQTENITSPAGIHLQNPFNTVLGCGQIRLLQDVERITYVVLLRRWEKHSFVTMTFSHYDFPATDEEFKPEFDGGMYLNILQAWNTRTLQDATLQKSWLIGTMPEADCDDAWEFWTHFINGKELPERILCKTGTAIADEKDIRIQYMQEEFSVFQKIDSQELNTEAYETEKNTLGFEKIAMPALWEMEELSLAAGTEKRNIFVECKINGLAEIITFEYAQNEEKLRVKIYNSEKSAYSSAFDGWDLIDINGVALKQISQGRCIVEHLAYFDGRCTLRNSSGTIFILEKL